MYLARSLESAVERRVIDATGLSGNFNIELLWTPTPGIDVQPNAAVAGTEIVSIFTAIQEQLGLKLEPARAPAKVLVIDSIERPTPN